MSKSQVNFRLPDTLIAALKDQAESEGVTSTEMAIRLLEAGLGLSRAEEANDKSGIEQRIEECIAPLREQVSQLNQCIELRIATVIQKELDPLLGESLKQRAIAPKLNPEKLSPELGETRSRKELGKLFNVTHEAIRIWEESGKLIDLGWQRIPHIKSPVKYSRTTPLIAPVSALD